MKVEAEERMKIEKVIEKETYLQIIFVGYSIVQWPSRNFSVKLCLECNNLAMFWPFSFQYRTRNEMASDSYADLPDKKS